MISTLTVPDNAYTHAGVFHADDVFSAALLVELNPNVAVHRGNNPPEHFDGIIFDIGGGLFDHHGACRRTRSNGIPYASFGLLWERYGKQLLCSEDAAAFDEAFVQPLDDADNGGTACVLSQIVADFNPYPPADGAAYNTAFGLAVSWAQDVLHRRIASVRHSREACNTVIQRMQECDGSILVLDQFVPWATAVIGSTYVYVIYPSVRGGYNVQAVPERTGDRSMVMPFPAAWRGKTKDELRAITAIPGISYCHPTGFLCAADSKEGALCAARLAMSTKDDSSSV